jgi:hypothetical protein
MSSSLKSRKFVRGGNHDSIVRLLRRPEPENVEELILLIATMDEFLSAFLVIEREKSSVPSRGRMLSTGSSSSSSLMLIKFCFLRENLFGASVRPSRQSSASDLLRRLTDEVIESDLMDLEIVAKVGESGREGDVGEQTSEKEGRWRRGLATGVGTATGMAGSVRDGAGLAAGSCRRFSREGLRDVGFGWGIVSRVVSTVNDAIRLPLHVEVVASLPFRFKE